MDIVIIYMLFGLIIGFFAEPIFNGGNLATQFWLDNKLSLTEQKIISGVFWLPLTIIGILLLIKNYR